MQLLLIRHAVAEDRDEFATTGRDDSERPLTKPGRFKMRRIAKALRKTVRGLDVLASSPFVRARQTAEIVSDAYDGQEIVITETMVPTARLDAFITWLRKQKDAEVVAAVGHDPHIGTLATWLLSGTEELRVKIGKGGVCLIEFEARPAAGEGVLQWSLTPGMLRRLDD